MAARSFLRFAALAATLLAGASCVYPFDVEIPETEFPVVVEGDIHVGGTTTLTVSRSTTPPRPTVPLILLPTLPRPAICPVS